VALKLGRRVSTERCKYCRTWQIHECGYNHRGLFGSLSCSQCRSRGRLCTDSKHPRGKRRSDY